MTKPRLHAIVQCKEQGEMHVREKLVHAEAQNLVAQTCVLHVHEALEDIPVGSLSVRMRRYSPKVQQQSQRLTQV